MDFNENYIRDNINVNELGLNFIEYEYEYNTNIGQIDILCKDINGNLIPIEVKLGKADDSTIGKILAYMKIVNAKKGIIIAKSFSNRVKLIAKDLNIDLIEYELNIKLKYLNNNYKFKKEIKKSLFDF